MVEVRFPYGSSSWNDAAKLNNTKPDWKSYAKQEKDVKVKDAESLRKFST